jgi:hypothetical protein
VSRQDSIGIKSLTSPSSAGSFTCLFDRRSGEVSRPQKVAQRKFSKIDRRLNAWRISRAQEGSPPGSCNGFVLCGIPYRGRRCGLRYLFQPYEPASHFPYRAGPKGHREAPLLICNFSRVTQATLRCKSRNRLISCALRDFLRITTDPGSRNPEPAVERIRFLWETASKPRQIRLQTHAISWPN